MRIKIDFITNSSSVNYTLSDTNHDRKELIINIEGFAFNLFKEFPRMYIFKNMDELEEEYDKNTKAHAVYQELIESGKVVYEIWIDGRGSLMSGYLYHNRIGDLPDGVEDVDIYLGG